MHRSLKWTVLALLAAGFAIVIVMVGRKQVSDAKGDGPDRLAQLSGGFLQLSYRIKEVAATGHTLTTYIDLCNGVNARYPTEDRLNTNGNPCPELLPVGKYHWLQHWKSETNLTETPLLWAYCNYQEPLAYYVTLSGEKKVAQSNSFARTWHIPSRPIITVE